MKCKGRKESKRKEKKNKKSARLRRRKGECGKTSLEIVAIVGGRRRERRGGQNGEGGDGEGHVWSGGRGRRSGAAAVKFDYRDAGCEETKRKEGGKSEYTNRRTR